MMLYDLLGQLSKWWCISWWKYKYITLYHHNFDKLVDDVLNVINNTPINITAAENYDTLRNIVTVILKLLNFRLVAHIVMRCITCIEIHLQL